MAGSPKGKGSGFISHHIRVQVPYLLPKIIGRDFGKG